MFPLSHRKSFVHVCNRAEQLILNCRVSTRKKEWCAMCEDTLFPCRRQCSASLLLICLLGQYFSFHCACLFCSLELVAWDPSWLDLTKPYLYTQHCWDLWNCVFTEEERTPLVILIFQELYIKTYCARNSEVCSKFSNYYSVHWLVYNILPLSLSPSLSSSFFSWILYFFLSVL